MASASSEAVPIRPGEHACCRFGEAAEGERLAAAFVRNGLSRGNKVLYLCDGEPPDFVRKLESWDARTRRAIKAGQLDVRCAEETYLPDGTFHADWMLDKLREEQEQATRSGYAALSVTGEMTWALNGDVRSDQLLEYETRASALAGDDTLMFCQYDQSRFAGANTRSDAVVEAHGVDISPELATIGNAGGHVSAGDVDGLLRVTGALDFCSAALVAGVIDGRDDDGLRLDLADLDFVDVAGMRALRGDPDRSLRIEGASEAVLRLAVLLGWDRRPGIDMRA
jgi:hypothetical protein